MNCLVLSVSVEKIGNNLSRCSEFVDGSSSIDIEQFSPEIKEFKDSENRWTYSGLTCSKHAALVRAVLRDAVVRSLRVPDGEQNSSQ